MRSNLFERITTKPIRFAFESLLIDKSLIIRKGN